MNSIPVTAPPRSARESLTAAAAVGPAIAVLVAFGRRLARDAPWPADANIWLVIHLASVLPALPLGAWLLLARKGGGTHRRLGRLWAAMMVFGALSSFGVTGLMGHLSPIHLLSGLTLIGIARGVWCAVHGDVAGHRQAMTLVYTGLVIAGGLAFVPGRLLGNLLWS